MDKLESILSELKSAVNSPKLYIVSYLDFIRSQIDIECQAYLTKDDLIAEDKEKAIQDQLEMINAVDLFQRKCLLNLDINEYGIISIEDLEKGLKNLDMEDRNAMLNAEKDLYSALFQRQKLLFMNQGIIFLDDTDFETCMKYRYNYCKYPFILFGVLVIIEDEFLPNNRKDLLNLETAEIGEDLSNVYLRAHFMKKCLFPTFNFTAVTRIQLDLKLQEKLEPFNCKLDKLVLKNWLDELPALKKIQLYLCKLAELEQNTFANNVTNSTSISLRSTEISVIPLRVFKNLNNLIELDLSYNKIGAIPDGAFQGLNNLKILHLMSNQICTISEGTFLGLDNLTRLDLMENKIACLNNDGAFKFLKNLSFLSLKDNQMSAIPETLFKGMSNLTEVILSYNQISFVPKGVFTGLPLLDELDLSYNQIDAISEDAFQGLDNLTHLHLNENSQLKLKAVPGKVFKDLVKLKYLGFEETYYEFASFKSLTDFVKKNCC